MNSNNNHNAVFSTPVPILLILLVIILAFTGKLNAGENSTDANDKSATELQAPAEGQKGLHQDTEAGRYDRYYRTLISDPVDGREKLVELRYTKEGRLTEVLIDDEVLTRVERRKNEKIIRKAMAEERDIEKDVNELIDEFGRAVEETMEVVTDIFVSGFDENSDQEDSDADSSGSNTRQETRKKERKAKLTTLEELESGQRK